MFWREGGSNMKSSKRIALLNQIDPAPNRRRWDYQMFLSKQKWLALKTPQETVVMMTVI